MNRIDETFAALKQNGRSAFMPYLMAGDPDAATTVRLILAMEKAGANLIELGVPFSDPIADGATIQEAAIRSLKNGTNLKTVFEIVREVRKTSQIPILLMGYYNPFFHYGLEAFCRDAVEAGADGLIVPDLQPDCVDELREHADGAGLHTIFLIAPTSTEERMRVVEKESRGFVYAVSLTGVTGARSTLPPDLGDFVAHAREFITKPIAVGFGISDATMAKEVAKIADGVIVGSAVVKRIGQAAAENSDPIPPVAAFVEELCSGL